jgi:5,10-methylenetetrahydromethanopterin reductase
LGIGRGDSAVHKLGRYPVALDRFESYLTRVQSYLRSESPNLNTDGVPQPMWFDTAQLPKPPMDVAATGPKVIAIGARQSERVSFAVGADPARLKWAIDHARQARQEAGGDPDDLTFGAYLHVMADEDVVQSRERIRGIVSVFARFAAMNTPKPLETFRSDDGTAVSEMGNAWQAIGHGEASSPQAMALDDEFLDRYAILGPPGLCVDRLSQLMELGIDRFYLMSMGHDNPVDGADKYYDRFAADALGRLRAVR